MLTRLQATGWMGLEEVDLPLGQITMIHGPNEQGKTRLLEAIRMVVLGKCAADRPVTLGAEGAELRLEVDMEGERMKIIRPLTADGKTEKLIVERGTEGQMKRETGRVQEFLNGLVRPYQVDVMAFYNDKPADQRAILLSTVTDIHYTPEERIEGVDYSQHPLEVIAAEVDVLFRLRARLNSDVENRERLAVGTEEKLPAGFDADAARAVNTLGLMEDLVAARRRNEMIATLDEGIRMREKDVADLEARLRTERLNLENARIRRAEMETVDLTPLEQAVSDYDAQKATLAFYDSAHQARQEAAEIGKQASALTQRITALRRRPAALLAQATTPIEGLGVDEEGRITIHDLPLSNLSCEQRINLAVRVACATRGEIPLFLVDNLEGMDTAHRDLLTREALASGMQWIMARTADGEFEVEYLEGEGVVTAAPPCDQEGEVDPEAQEAEDLGSILGDSELVAGSGWEELAAAESTLADVGAGEGTLKRLRPYEVTGGGV